MTAIALRTSPDVAPQPVEHHLDLFGVSNHASTIHISRSFFDDSGSPAPEPHRTLFETACAVFVTDKVVQRAATEDGWTRTLELALPEYPPLTTSGDRQLESTLRFLTGDDWIISRHGPPGDWPLCLSEASGVDTVCLFSGGLDSFCGAVSLLEKGMRVLLVGHNDSSVAPHHQKLLRADLEAAYPGQVEFRGIRVTGASKFKDEQFEPLEMKESTYRSRSIIFLASGLLAAAPLGSNTPLYVPENGLISLNVPLNPARRGTASTRTTHPHFMSEFTKFASTVGVNHPIINPYQFRTKGEMIGELNHLPVFARNVHNTVSCSHPERRNDYPGWAFVDRTKPNCGYCFPCLIRRAALHTGGLDDPDEYRVDIHSAPQVVAHDRSPSQDLRAVIGALNRGESPNDVLRTGPLLERHSDYHDVHVRGREELRQWLKVAPTSSQIAGLVK